MNCGASRRPASAVNIRIARPIAVLRNARSSSVDELRNRSPPRRRYAAARELEYHDARSATALRSKCSMGDIVNLNQIRKRRERAAAERRAKENRAQHGRSKDERVKAARESEKANRELDEKKLEQSRLNRGLALDGNAAMARHQNSL